IKKILRKIMQQQNYESYWALTNAFTNYKLNGKFYKTVKICVDFIDKYSNEKYSSEKYVRLQKLIKQSLPKDELSIRKSINQLVKMGVINPFLVSYNHLTKDYLNSKTEKKAKTILSKIVYSNFSANKAVNEENNINHLSFLVRTLVEFGNLSKEQVTGLMLVDLNTYNGTFISQDDILYYQNLAIEIDFAGRKYNQIDHFWNLLGKLDDLKIVNNRLYFEEDAKRIFGEDLKVVTKVRDPYLHRLYKNQLQEECEELYGNPVCVLEKLTYPVLIASHIKPFIESNEIEAYDPNNGLLLSRTIDSLFDLKYISFTDEGKIIFSKRLSGDVVEFWKNYTLDKHILNEQRRKYLEYHRQLLTKIDAVA
ncbi:MAG: HNH endonuclease, partial [Paludibacteraceae bacterium]|nr:HNH endonuclease [Paludibacteraceae bacterium]